MRQRAKILPDSVELAIAMKVLVSTNLGADLSIAHGEKGRVEIYYSIHMN